MKFTILLAVAAAVLGGCSGTYKSSQTPDDLYYSPARGTDEGVAAAGYYDEYTSSSEDRYLKMKVRDHYRWSAIDDYAYWNDSRYLYDQGFYYNYTYQNNYAYFNPWMWNNSYYYNYLSMGWYGYNGNGWNSLYNPWHTVIYYKNPRTYNSYTSGRNLTAFGNNNYNNSNNNNRYYTPSNNGQTKYNNSNNNSNNYNNSQSRTFNSSTPAPSNSAGGRSGGYSSSGSGSAGGRAPRGN